VTPLLVQVEPEEEERPRLLPPLLSEISTTEGKKSKKRKQNQVDADVLLDSPDTTSQHNPHPFTCIKSNRWKRERSFSNFNSRSRDYKTRLALDPSTEPRYQTFSRYRVMPLHNGG
jgi:hypothetical protein